jgi:hypothetical protein
MAIKKTVFVRYEGETVYRKHIEIDPSKLTDILKLPEDVFATVDGIRISIKRDEFDILIKEHEQIKPN